MDNPFKPEDVISLAKAVQEMSPNYFDNPNGGYEYTCPLCYVTENGGRDGIDMKDIRHLPTCAYLIAKDLLTNIK